MKNIHLFCSSKSVNDVDLSSSEISLKTFYLSVFNHDMIKTRLTIPKSLAKKLYETPFIFPSVVSINNQTIVDHQTTNNICIMKISVFLILLIIFIENSISLQIKGKCIIQSKSFHLIYIRWTNSSQSFSI